MDVVFRMAVAGFCIVAPSLLFIGFVRGLERLRDDDLVNRVLDRVDESGGGSHATSPAAVLTGGMAGGDRRPGVVTCTSCGAPNPSYSTFCGSCLEKLE